MRYKAVTTFTRSLKQFVGVHHTNILIMPSIIVKLVIYMWHIRTCKTFC